MQSSTKSTIKSAIIRDEISRQVYGSPSSQPENKVKNKGSVTSSKSDQYSQNQYLRTDLDIEGLNKEQNILLSLQSNLAELSGLESKLNFMVKEVRHSLKKR